MTTETEIRRVLGEFARHVPCWMYVQEQGDGIVSFVGASRVSGAHPLRYGSDVPHQLILGELVVRPHRAVETRGLVGHGLAGLVSHPLGDLDEMVRSGAGREIRVNAA